MRLPPVLTVADLPAAELQAARLDGDVLALDQGFASIDEPVGLGHRARGVLAGAVERAIAERMSAAWIWGATATPPAAPQLCVAIGARVHSHHLARVREVVIDEDEIVDVDGVRVTTPLRTVLDLVRGDPFGHGEASAVAVLTADHRLDFDACVGALHTRRNLPNRRRALLRLDQAMRGDQPLLTR